jgi:fructose PTS system EIIBC or EIIC component
LLLSELLPPERIRIPLQARQKDELLRELVDMLNGQGGITDPDQVLRAVQQREAVLSTGIGNGVAIPHAKSDAIGGLRMVAGVAATPVDFDALDGQPVQLFFLLVGPETEAGAHIKTLSRISRLLRREQVRRQLASARDPEEFYRALQEAESA